MIVILNCIFLFLRIFTQLFVFVASIVLRKFPHNRVTATYLLPRSASPKYILYMITAVHLFLSNYLRSQSQSIIWITHTYYNLCWEGTFQRPHWPGVGFPLLRISFYKILWLRFFFLNQIWYDFRVMKSVNAVAWKSIAVISENKLQEIHIYFLPKG